MTKKAARQLVALRDLPLFCDDRRLGIAILGPERACEWPPLALLLERQGFPKIHPLMAGRYVPAVEAFFSRMYGLTARPAAAPDGPENMQAWNLPRQRRHQA